MNQIFTTVPKLLIPLLLATSLAACDRNRQEEAQAEAPEAIEKEQENEVAADDDHDDHGEVHLGAAMFEIGNRFSAVWFAAEAGNVEMVDYQIHEIEEVIAELEGQGLEENGVDVYARLSTDIGSRLESLETAMEAGDSEAFEASYETVVSRCTSCHADTGHDFINVKTPEYNPYPGLDFSAP